MSWACSEVRPGEAARVSEAAPIEPDSIEAYLAALASAAPAPGGGSAAALAGALGAALLAMVCRVTAKHDADAAPLAALADEADRARHRLTALAADDARAYASVIAARRAPAAERSAAVQTALRRATEVPLDLVGESVKVLALCDRITRVARISTLGDLSVAAILAHGALQAGAVTARINLVGITDSDVTGAIGRRLDALVAEGRTLSARTEAALADRSARPA